jgi:hypothetical protein
VPEVPDVPSIPEVPEVPPVAVKFAIVPSPRMY